MRILIVLTLVIFASCTSLEKEYNTHLNNGLDTYSRTREVNLNFVPGISMKKIAFIKKSDDQLIMVIRLNDNAVDSEVQKYSLAIKTYLDKDKYDSILAGDEYISTPIKPYLVDVNGFKYIEVPFDLKVDRIDKIEFFLFDRDKFRKVLSKPITISNVGL